MQGKKRGELIVHVASMRSRATVRAVAVVHVDVALKMMEGEPV